MNPNEEEDLSIYEEYKLYPKEKYIELLKPDEITNYPLDEYVKINGIEFKMLDDLKIYIIENNLKLSFDGKEDILSEPLIKFFENKNFYEAPKNMFFKKHIFLK